VTASSTNMVIVFHCCTFPLNDIWVLHNITHNTSWHTEATKLIIKQLIFQ